MRVLAFLLCFVASISFAGEQVSPGGTVAFLGLVFLDTSTEGAYNGVREDETARLVLLEELIAKRFTTENLVLLDTNPIAETLENTVNPANCYGCEIRMARELNADFVVVGVVQKVSNLIISMNLVMRDVETEAVIKARSVDVRSNTDESWQRGMNYILKTAFFKS